MKRTFAFITLAILVIAWAAHVEGKKKTSKQEFAAYCSGYFIVMNKTLSDQGESEAASQYRNYSGAFEDFARSHGLPQNDIDEYRNNGIRAATEDYAGPEKSFSAETIFACRYFDQLMAD